MEKNIKKIAVATVLFAWGSAESASAGPSPLPKFSTCGVANQDTSGIRSGRARVAC